MVNIAQSTIAQILAIFGIATGFECSSRTFSETARALLMAHSQFPSIFGDLVYFRPTPRTQVLTYSTRTFAAHNVH